MNSNSKSKNKSTNSKQQKKQNRQRSQSANRKASRKKAKRQNVPRGAIRRQKMYISECSQDYLKALTDPWGVSKPVCIPDIIDQQSAKYKLYAKGTFEIGTQGFGFIVCNPKMGGVNNANSIYYSQTAYTGTVTATSGTGVGQSQLTQAPYSSTDLVNGITPRQVRCVAYGVRIRYIGTELNRGGRMILMRKPRNDTVVGLDETTALADRTFISLPNKRQWVGINFFPVDSQDYEYEEYANIGTILRLGIIVNGVAGNQYEYEICTHQEYIGTVVNPTSSHSDIVGISAIREAVNHHPTVDPAGPSLFNSFLNLVTSAGAEAMSHPTTATVASNLLLKGVGSWA